MHHSIDDLSGPSSKPLSYGNHKLLLALKAGGLTYIKPFCLGFEFATSELIGINNALRGWGLIALRVSRP